MEIIVKHTPRAYNDCIGTEKMNKDIMLSFMSEKDEFIDIFLTKEQAIKFYEELGKVLMEEDAKKLGLI